MHGLHLPLRAGQQAQYRKDPGSFPVKKIPLINFFQDADPLLKKNGLKDYWTVTKGWLCREGGKF